MMNDLSLSCDATLKALAVSAGKISPGFSASRKNYSVYVAHGIDSIRVIPTANESGATLTVNGTAAASSQASGSISLDVGRNIITVEVTARDGKTKTTYTVKVIRAYPTPAWVRVKENAPWVPRDSAGELVFNNRMWLFGGYIPDLISDVWSSADGTNWTKAGMIPCEAGVNIPVTYAYDDKMWVTSNDGQLFASRDGVNWSLVTDQAPWRGRYAAGGVAFAGKMWVMGGKGEDIFNDIWSSTDGIHWTLETATAPWSRRQLFSLTVHDDKIWVIGGGITIYHPFRAYSDVWCSPDGKNWTKVTDQSPWPVRIWNTSVAYKNRLWVFGGFRAEPTWNNFNDVWYSSDGANWNQLISETIWSPRHEISAYVFDDKLWVIGGNAWPLMNDVWCLKIRGLTFLTQPVIEEFMRAQYSYRAYADFNESGQKVRYRLVNSPGWLTVDSETGTIRGTPDAVGDATVTVEAYDDAGETARQTYTLHVLPVISTTS